MPYSGQKSLNITRHVRFDPLKWVNKWSLQLSSLRWIMMQNPYINSKSDSYSPEFKKHESIGPYESPLSKETIAFLFYWPILVNSPAWQCGKGCYLLSPHVWLMPGMISIQDQSSSTVSLKASWTKSTSITSSRRFHNVYPIRNPNAFEWWSVHIAEKKTHWWPTHTHTSPCHLLGHAPKPERSSAKDHCHSPAFDVRKPTT